MKIVARFRSSLVRGDAHFVLDEKPLLGAWNPAPVTEGRALGTLLLWVPVFHGFRVLTVAVLWTPALLKLNGISPANTAFVVAFNGLGVFYRPINLGSADQRLRDCARTHSRFFVGSGGDGGLGYGASSIALAATFIGLVGVFMGLGTGGAIALATTIYPTPIRSTGAGWGMAIGRFRPNHRSAHRRSIARRRLDSRSNHDRHRLWRD